MQTVGKRKNGHRGSQLTALFISKIFTVPNFQRRLSSTRGFQIFFFFKLFPKLTKFKEI